MSTSPFRPLALALALALTLTACDASVDSATTDLTEVEIAEATTLIAEAVAEDTGGAFASAADLTASVSARGLSDGPRTVRGDRRRAACRGGEQTVSYDGDTGTHTVSYVCQKENPRLSREFTALLTYQFRDVSGGFVADPQADWSLVSSVAFDGQRSGSASGTRGNASGSMSFEQTGDWLLTNANVEGAPALLSVQQQRSGTSTRSNPRGTVSREYSSSISGVGIELVPAEDGGYAASGELSYTLTMDVVRGGETVSRDVEGTITLDGSERGLIRIFGVRGATRVSLGDATTGPQS